MLKTHSGLGSVSLSETQVLEHSIFDSWTDPVWHKAGPERLRCPPHFHTLALVWWSGLLVLWPRAKAKKKASPHRGKGKIRIKDLLCVPLGFLDQATSSGQMCQFLSEDPCPPVLP